MNFTRREFLGLSSLAFALPFLPHACAGETSEECRTSARI